MKLIQELPSLIHTWMARSGFKITSAMSDLVSAAAFVSEMV